LTLYPNWIVMIGAVMCVGSRVRIAQPWIGVEESCWRFVFVRPPRETSACRSGHNAICPPELNGQIQAIVRGKDLNLLGGSTSAAAMLVPLERVRPLALHQKLIKLSECRAPLM